MFNKFTKSLFVASLVMPAVALGQTMSLEERVAELEANSSINIFTFSGMLSTRFDDIMKAEQTTPVSAASPAFDNKDLTYMRLKFQFNADANVSKYIKLYSRLTMSKHANTMYKSGTAPSGVAEDLSENNDYRSSAVYLEKAYADLTIPDSNFVFSLGRLPTVDGEPANFMDGRARMGTYPMLSYNSVFDGMALTYKGDDYMPQDNRLALRLIYTPFSQYNVGPSGYVTPPTTSSTTAPQNNPTMVAVTAAQVDWGMENLSWAQRMGVVLQHYQTGDLYYPGAEAPASTMYFNVAGTTLSVNMEGIASSGLDLSLNYLASTMKSSGSYLGAGFGTASTTEDTMRGGIFLLGTRYRLSSWVLGAEYVNGTQDSAYFGSNDDTLTDFYATKGDAYHLYVTKKFTQNLAFRIGYMDQAYKYSPTSVGASVDSDRKIQTAYANVRLDF